MANLQYNNSQSVARLGNKGIYINVVKNPKTGKLFMTDDAGNALGAVSSKCEEQIMSTKSIAQDLVVSDVTDIETGETFKMLHIAGSNNNVIASSRPATAVTSSKVDLSNAF